MNNNLKPSRSYRLRISEPALAGFPIRTFKYTLTTGLEITFKDETYGRVTVSINGREVDVLEYHQHKHFPALNVVAQDWIRAFLQRLWEQVGTD